MRKTTLLYPFSILLLAISLPAAAQQSNPDSLRKMRDDLTMQAALRYPALRMASVQLETIGGAHYTSSLQGKDFLHGRMDRQTSLKAGFTYPVFTAGTQELSLGVVYQSQETGLRNTINELNQFHVSDGEYDFRNLTLSANYRRTDTLFHKPVLWGGTVLTKFSLQSSFVRAIGLVYVRVPLKTTRTTRIAVGLVGAIDPSSLIPVIPSFSYWHRFAGSPWEISLDLPTHLFVSRSVFSRGLLSLGTELDQNTLLRKMDGPYPLQGGLALRDLDLKTGFTLEFPLFRKMLIGCSGGLLTTMSYRIQDPGKPNNQYIAKINRDPAPYFNVHIALLR
ncbi:MAG TPA: hypothetical protein VNW04_18995 [Puia sp.]|jgi:hypothetical protein|nr:hypothetical protein [Puia sp.]